LVAWIALAEAFGDTEKVGDVAVVGPIVGTVSAPVVAAVIDTSGPDVLFYGLAALHLVPLVFVRTTRLDAASRPRQPRHRPTRAALAILLCLGATTFGGSAVFVFAAAIGQDQVGLAPLAVSLAFSANALAGVPSARFRGHRPLPGVWMVVTSTCAIVVGTVHHPAAYWVALPVWGFAFWMGTPGAFGLLAERSHHPQERAGDAQAIMALGRVIGPLLGGLLYAVSASALGLVAGGIMMAAGLVMIYVEWRIHPEVLGDLVGSA
jgi:DHA1 family inner membrane transport protein